MIARRASGARGWRGAGDQVDGLGEHRERAGDVVVAVGERDVDLRHALHDSPPQALRVEGPQASAVRRQRRPLTSYSLDPEPRLTMNARSSGNRDDPRTPPGSARAAVSSMRFSSSDRERSMACLPPGAITRPLVAPAYRLPRACASPMARSAEVLERWARATYTGATREPEGGMRELVFALEFRGSAGPVPGVDGRRRARTSATTQV